MVALAPISTKSSTTHITDLRYFLEAAIGLGSKTETIAAHYGTGVDGYILTHHAVVVDFYARVKDGIVANLYIVANEGIGEYFYIVAQTYVFADIAEGADENVLSQFSCFGYIAGFLDAGHLLGHHFLVLWPDRVAKAVVGIGNAQRVR